MGGADHPGGCQHVLSNKQQHWGAGSVVIIPHFTTCATTVHEMCKAIAGVWRRANSMDSALSVGGIFYWGGQLGRSLVWQVNRWNIG